MSHVQYLYIKDCQLHLWYSFIGICPINPHATDFRETEWSEEVKVNITIRLLQKNSQRHYGSKFQSKLLYLQVLSHTWQFFQTQWSGTEKNKHVFPGFSFHMPHKKQCYNYVFTPFKKVSLRKKVLLICVILR